ncbi:DUF6164 family protein [Aliikangiella sp. G2MR2-5]|uniref:DUF6164 family protein n=1 Tax=Aliikangiella sp. G2MR2-5 TaxID=2788943 RepID=UPI0018A88A0F|nr:DUF6164 family protein [Aliikangiella sp. G2MR2-5]
MAKLLFKLAGVPEDEAEGVRQLLEDNNIEYYETSSGLLGLSFAAIWIKQDDAIELANELLNNFQHERYLRAKKDQEVARQNGTSQNYLQAFIQSPLLNLLVILFVLALLYFVLSPFLVPA